MVIKSIIFINYIFKKKKNNNFITINELGHCNYAET